MILHRLSRHAGLMALLLAATTAYAGSPTPPANPADPGSAMFTLEDLYLRLTTGAAGSKRSGGFVAPGGAPGSTMHTLDQIMGAAPAPDPAAATDAQVLSGRNYWSLSTGQWGTHTGAMPNVGAQNITPGIAETPITAGYHDGTGKVAGDANLVPGNIKAGATIFGVAGDGGVVDTSTGDAAEGDILAGKKAFVGGAQVTGTLSTQTLSNATTTVAAGNYAATDLNAVDPDLVPGNLRAGTTLFGVSGSGTVVDTSTGNASGSDILLGRQAWSNGILETGTRAGGILLKPGGYLYQGKPRWYVNNDGTVTDVRTGLVWLSDIDHVSHPFIATTGAPIDCMRYLYSIRHGNPVQLTDNSQPGDWGMPTYAELATLWEPDIYNQQIGSYTGRQAFDNAWTASYYWTSTPVADAYGIASPDKVIVVNMMTGELIHEDKLALAAIGHYVWPIRRIHR